MGKKIEEGVRQSVSLRNTPIFILCGGLGTRMKEETEFVPKPMVYIGHEPILMHIIKKYYKHGFRRFVLCLGYKSRVIKEYFLNYYTLNSDFSLNLSSNSVSISAIKSEVLDIEVDLVYTGELTMTGGRIARAAERYLKDAAHFGVTYGDGLTDVDLKSHFEFHLSNNKTGTLLGVNPPSRFGEIKLKESCVEQFCEKPEIRDHWVNGGFFFFKKDFLNYVSKDEACVLEQAPLTNLARDGQLMVNKHSGYWACMDTQREREEFQQKWSSQAAPWLK